MRVYPLAALVLSFAAKGGEKAARKQPPSTIKILLPPQFRPPSSLLTKAKDPPLKIAELWTRPQSTEFAQGLQSSGRKLMLAGLVFVGALCARSHQATAAASRALHVDSSSSSTATAAAFLGWKNLVLAGSLVMATGGFGLFLSGVPGLARAVLQACLRSTLQLYLVAGFVLTKFMVAANTRPWMVLSWIGFTAVLAAQEAYGRVAYTYPALQRHLTQAVIVGSGSVISSSVLLKVLGTLEPWFSPRTWIPLSGMLFGNSLTATSLAASTITKEFATNQAQVELRLTRGATWKEALSDVMSTVYTTALTPLINSLSVAGIIHLPGMMVGQILAGQSPFQAAAYQLLIFFLIASTSCLTVQVLARLATHDLVDQTCHRLQLDALTPVDGDTRMKGSRMAAIRRLGSLFKTPSTLNVSAHSGLESLPLIESKTVRLESLTGSNSTPTVSIQNMKVRRTNVKISLDLEQNDIVAITGRSGIGKSQVLRTIAGLEKVERSSLKLAHDWATDMSMAEWRSRVALVPQDRPSLEGTPNEFFDQACEYASQKKKIIDKNPADYVMQWGLDIKAMDQPWSTLSGGESQRVMLAIALALKPEVLLLDESLSALDEATAQQVERTLQDLHIPILIVSHSEAQVERFCSRRLNLEGSDASPSLTVQGSNSSQ